MLLKAAFSLGIIWLSFRSGVHIGKLIVLALLPPALMATSMGLLADATWSETIAVALVLTAIGVFLTLPCILGAAWCVLYFRSRFGTGLVATTLASAVAGGIAGMACPLGSEKFDFAQITAGLAAAGYLVFWIMERIWAAGRRWMAGTT